MAQFDPELTFKIDPMNGREAEESGLRLKASVAPISLKKSASWSGPR
jgi:hypothetical protein